jgi:hypothetical protein
MRSDRRPYVKLRKETDGDAPAAGAEDILRGELNQAVQVFVCLSPPADRRSVCPDSRVLHSL